MANREDNVGGNFYDPLIQKGLKMGSYAVDAAAGTVTLEASYPPVILCDAGGGAATITLPAEADSANLCFVIFNTANAAEAITVEDDAAATVITLDQSQAGLVYCDGTTWRGFIGGIT